MDFVSVWLPCSLVGGLTGLALERLRRERAVLRCWELAPTHKARRALEAVAARLSDGAELVTLSLRHAVELAEAGRLEEARQALTTAQGLLRCHVVDNYAFVNGMARFSRAAPALGRVAPLPSGGWQLPLLAARMQWHNLARLILVDPGERFRFRSDTLGGALLQLAASLRRAAQRCARPGDNRSAWHHVERAAHDVGLLTRESLACLQLLLAGLSARPRVGARLLVEPRS